MKRLLVCSLVFMAALIGNSISQAYDFGDGSSSTLVTKAWGALAKNDLNAVLAYTNKCIELYAGQAGAMQAGLKDYAGGGKEQIFKYWALNDVATSYYIQGKAYSNANQKDKTKEAFNKLIQNYSFGQCWDTNGWFWKPAEAAQKELAEM